MTFGERLRQARLEAGLSQAELGGDEFTVSYVSHLEAGRREPSARVTATFEERLALPRGYLSGSDWGRTRQDEEGLVSTADLTAQAAAVQRMRELASATAVAEAAGRTAELALRLDRPEVWFLMTGTQVQALVASDDFAAAAGCATALTRHPWVQSQPALLAESHTLASRTHRRVVDLAAAIHHAHAALAVTEGLGDPGLRAEAVIAALATRGMPAEPLVAELQTLHHRVAGTHLGGRIAWTLGNEAFNDGLVDDGLAWHQVAHQELNPDIDHRSWARFVAATCLQRVRHHVDDGVAELLELARQHLGRLGTTAELADLARTEARWLCQSGRCEQARQVLDDAFDLADLSDLTRGRLHLERARVRCDGEDVSADALEAARLLTRTGDSTGAREAWELHDAAQRLHGG